MALLGAPCMQPLRSILVQHTVMTEVPMPIDEKIYKDIMSRHPGGVTVVTTIGTSGKAFGLTVSAFCTVSLHPPRILIVIDKASHTLSTLLASKAFTVSFLEEESADLAMHFASADEDKFGSLPHGSFIELDTGPALVGDATAYMQCRTAQEIDSGDHWILVGAVERGVILNDAEPLIYSHRQFRKMMPL